MDDNPGPNDQTPDPLDGPLAEVERFLNWFSKPHAGETSAQYRGRMAAMTRTIFDTACQVVGPDVYADLLSHLRAELPAPSCAVLNEALAPVWESFAGPAVAEWPRSHPSLS